MYHSSCIIRSDRSWRVSWDGHAAHMVDNSSLYRISARTNLGKRPLGRRERRWKDIIEIVIKYDERV